MSSSPSGASYLIKGDTTFLTVVVAITISPVFTSIAVVVVVSVKGGPSVYVYIIHVVI
jgi:hypothetical protein